MQQRISRFLLGSLVLIAAASPVAAQRRDKQAAKETAPENLSVQERLDRWYQRAQRSAPGEWGIAVGDQQGRLLWGIQPTRPLVPASTVKLLTTGFARSVLGGDARRSTRVIGSGQ